jgi:hypothetical protein
VIAEPHAPELLLHPRHAIVEVVEAGVQIEVLPSGELRVEARLLEYDPEDTSNGGAFTHNVVPEDERLPLGGPKEGAQDGDDRRLPRTVRPEKPVERPRLDPQVDAIDGRKVAEAPRQGVCLQGSERAPMRAGSVWFAGLGFRLAATGPSPWPPAPWHEAQYC